MRKSTSLPRLFLLAIVTATLTVYTSSAPAQITYLTQDRSCETDTYAQPTPWGQSMGAAPYTTAYPQSAPDFGPFDGTCLDSTLTPNSITASGGSYYDPTGGGNIYDVTTFAQSDMLIRFRLAQPALFTGSLSTFPIYTQGGSIVPPPSGWEDQVFWYRLTGPSGLNGVPSNNILPAGDYLLNIGADVGFAGDFNYYAFDYDLNFTLGPVPEPSALGLIAIGTLGLLGRRPTLNT